MSNEQLIKSALAWAVATILAVGLVVLLSLSGKTTLGQNSNQNSNSNSNTSGNASSSQNKNANMSNRSAGNANAGEQAAMGNQGSQDQKFLMDAALGGMVEVELGRWAAQKGTSEGVKQFGRRMVDDHSAANKELTSLASSKGITLPTALDEKHQAQVSKITRLSGADFDRAYIKMMLSDHRKDVSEFEKQSTKAVDADVKAFAGKTLPTLKEHLTMIQALSGSTGGGNSNNGGSKNNNGNTNSGGSKNSNSNGNSNRP